MKRRQTYLKSVLLTWALAAIVLAACGADGPDTASNTGESPDAGGGSDAPTDIVAGDDGSGGCVPKTCTQLGVDCGTAPDGCGDTTECGTCPDGTFCGGGGANLCGTSACVPKTCAQLGASCGSVSDGCSNVIECGTCVSPDVCGGGGVPNQCGCKPQSCAQLGAECGVVDTGCGQEDCGNCDSGEECTGNSCIVDPCADDPCNGHGWCTKGVCECDPGYAGSGCDTCDGNWQLDPVMLDCRPPSQILGTPENDTLEGTDGDETIQGGDGDDTLRGLGGNDYLNGNAGADTLNGNDGRDAVHGGAGDDIVRGGAGADLLWGGVGNDQLFGDAGNDRLIGRDGDDFIDGGEGDDRYMIDGLGNDTFDDLSGNDAARCMPGVKVVSDTFEGGDRLLVLSTGGTVRIVNNSVETVLGCH